jgi:tetratricopeptide (TPR) repeat protein
MLERKVEEIPNHPRYHGALGIAYAGIGQKEDAIREGERAVELLPLSVDAVYAITEVLDHAAIYTMLGEFDLAMDKIEYLLSIPSWISVTLFDWDLRFAPLKGHPRYKELLSKYAIDQL